MQSTITVGKDGIIYTALAGADSVNEIKGWTENLAKTVREEYEKRGRVNVLTDLTHLELTKDIRSRQIVAEMEKENAPFIKKSAAFTADIRVRFLTGLIAKMSRRRNFIVFRTKEEALKWLNEKEAKKSKEDVIRETAFEVCHYLQENPNADLDEATDYIKALHDYSAMEGDEFELFAIQLGAANIAFNYARENPQKKEEEIIKDILENYGGLLEKYSQE